jgi:lipopolysaccharide/colanic/teichoic acid biosynthesis glycosyltransferase
MAIAKNSTFNFLIDILFISLAFILCFFYKYEVEYNYLQNYLPSFILFISIWILLSFAFKKYQYQHDKKLNYFLSIILKSNLLTLAIAASIMYVIRESHYSRFIVLGTIGLATIFETTFMSAYFSLRHVTPIPDSSSIDINEYRADEDGSQKKQKSIKKKQLQSRQEALFVEISKAAFNFIFQYANINSPETLIISTTSRFNLDSQLNEKFEAIVNIGKINNIRYLNKFFESANHKLPEGGLFIDYVETKNLRKQRIMRKFPPILNGIYYVFDFILKRVFPKFAVTKKIYFALTRGQNRVLTKAETYGRLYSCGFEIVDEKYVENHLFFIARKINEPLYPSDPTYGPFVRLRRIGKNNKIIKVYKLRTMHPYAEYLQDYMYKSEGLKEGGKFKSDFRVSTLGQFMRTFWIDELPMIYNLLRGDLKLVGVRPLSPQYFSLYDKELQELRTKFKPGLIPPFYVDKPKTLEEIIASEKKYLLAYQKHPLRTDIKYFFKSGYNIIFKNYRSS